MRILLTNDDGIFAPGIAALYREISRLGEVTVAAPAEHMSGAGHSITIYQPLRCDKVVIDNKFTGFSIWGSPADCVKLALSEICGEKIDLVVSGMNDNANVGINVFYSGTVAGAVEGAFYRIPSVAVSLHRDEPMDFEAGAKYGREVIEKLLPLEAQTVTNINIPRLSKGKPKGIKVVPQAKLGFDEHFEKIIDDDGETVYQLSGGMHREKGTETDVAALEAGFITVTPLNNDLTNHLHIPQLMEKFNE